MNTPAPEVVELEERAAAAKLKMAQVLREAGVPMSTWWRWRKGGVDPQVGTLRRVREALDQRLSEAA